MFRYDAIKKYYVMDVAEMTKIRQDAHSELYYGDDGRVISNASFLYNIPRILGLAKSQSNICIM
jgi:hypothetical protein